MRTTVLLCFMLVCFSIPSFAQQCDCASQLQFVRSYFEQNNPAFQKIKTNLNTHAAYLKEAAKIMMEAQKEKDVDLCIVWMDRYVTLVKDHHSGIGFNLQRKDLSTPEKIEEFKKTSEYLAFRKMAVDTSLLIPALQQKATTDIEGIYSDGRNTVFAIVKKKGTKDVYDGIVVKQNKLLDVGHVLMELTRKKDSTFDVIYNVGLLGFNFQKIFKNFAIEDGQMPTIGYGKTISASPNDKPYSFKNLTATTNYLKLSSFEYYHTAELDSFYNTLEAELKSKPQLIIDLRGNGGGSEKSYFNLLPYAYTNPLLIDSVDVWVSPENIKRYEESQNKDENLIRRMKAARPFSFIPQGEGDAYTWALDSGTIFPKKIALLFDRGTASAAEGMIYYLMQSKKVITIGENSGGYIGYGNVMTAKTPCGKFTIQSTTTKYNKKNQWEFVGIEPMHKPAKTEDWIQYALKLFEQ